MDDVLRSYATFSRMTRSNESVSLSNLSMYSQPISFKLCEKLGSPPEKALAIICGSAQIRYNEDKDSVVDACRLLADLLERWENTSCKPSKLIHNL